jgi:pimeloyl-ACP methyl ester carboxylesterase
VLIHPDFRGVNQRPEACGSELVVQDILSAVEFAQKKAVVDIRRIYLVGASGGGYASLLMAGRAPDIWAGVSAWCPIYDLRTWHAETSQRQLKYCDMLETVCGGAPGESPEVDEQYRVRSAATWLPHAHNVTLSINTGITDGHNGSVPVSHTLNAFNALAIAHDRIAESAIQSMVQNPNMPVELLQRIDDPLYHSKPALFRRVSGSTQVTIFEGGHEIIYEAALGWLEQQVKGNDPVWLVKQVPEVDMRELDSQSGK